MTLLDKQIQIETNCYSTSVDKYEREIEDRIRAGAGNELRGSKLIIASTIDRIAEKVTEYFKAPLKGVNHRTRMFIKDYEDKPKALALIILNTVLSNTYLHKEITSASLVLALTKALRSDYVIGKLKETNPKLFSHIEREYKKRGSRYTQSRKVKLGLMKAKLDIEDLNKETAKLGAVLINLLLSANVDIIEKYTKYDRGKQTNVFRLTNNCYVFLEEIKSSDVLFNVKVPILVVPPKDWGGMEGTGGMHTKGLYKFNLIKQKGKNKRLLSEFIKKSTDTRYIDIINRIQKTEWQINKRVLDVIETIVGNCMVDYDAPKHSKYLVGGLPYMEKQEASDYVKASDYGELHTEGKHIGTPIDKQAYKRWYAAVEVQKEHIITNMSKAIGLYLALKDAKEYKEYDKIWFSYQADFRGRIYPIQQHFNPQHKGSLKAMLQFANGVPISNQYEIDWFKIHGANCYGYDKLPYEGRINEIDRKTEEILKVASDPIGFREYWKDADEPFLYLAWCFEFSDWYHNPRDFRSHIPIGLDGTCNGIQVYSGLLLDEEGALAVNVIGKNRNDIYQIVADKVNKYLFAGDYEPTILFRKSDGTENVCTTQVEAESIAGKVGRSIVKRNVMTQPYSVTSYGMYQQIIDELKTYEAEGKEFWKGDKWVVARLLTQLNSKAILETVKGAKIGQEFLKKVTRDVTSRNSNVFFTSYLGFPILQDIRRKIADRIITEIGRITLYSNTDDIHKQKMENGIAPNFIHSLDATIMLLTVDKMKDCNSFHLIHDSYGVPVNAVKDLNKAVRESFIELFNSNPLNKFVRQVNPAMLDEVQDVIIGTLDLEKIRESEYIFS